VSSLQDLILDNTDPLDGGDYQLGLGDSKNFNVQTIVSQCSQ